MERSIAVIGAGAWGTAMAKALAEKGYSVCLWAFEKDLVQEINEKHTNSLFLPEVSLPSNLRASSDIREVALGKEHIILAIPSLFLVQTIKQCITVPDIMEGKPIISVLTKGLLETPKGFRLITEVLEDYLPGFYRGNLVYVSGPSHAEEVARGKMTGLISASANPKNAIIVRDLISSEKLLVFASLDPIGVQVCAAAKNVIAIAFGILDALKASSDIFGDNTESLLLAAGLNEIQTLGRALGATHPETFTSIAGVGDLDVTCRSVWGRNRRFGRDIVEKRVHEKFSSIDDLLARIKEVGYLPEGSAASKAIKAMSEERKLKLPICDGVFKILNREESPESVIRNIYSGPSGKVGAASGLPTKDDTEYPIADPSDGAKMWPIAVKYRDNFLAMMRHSSGRGKVTEDNVYQEGNPDILPYMDGMVEENLKPGSQIRHFERLEELLKKSEEGKSCLILMEHYSNMDLPAFSYLLRQRGDIGKAISDKLVAIAGVKLNETNPAVLAPTEAYSRIVVYPSTAMEVFREKDPKDIVQEVMKSTAVNRAATRALAEQKAKRKIILVFPAGTRYRPWNPSSRKGIREIDSYVKGFDYMIMISINGNILRLNPNGEMLSDLVCEDKVVMDCSPVYSCQEFREQAKREGAVFGNDKKQIVVDAIMRQLEIFHNANEEPRLKG